VHVVSDPIADLCAAVDRLAAQDLHDVPEVLRLAQQEQLMTAIQRLRAVEVQRLEVINAAETTVAECGRATRSWLIEEQLVNPGEASKRMRLARVRGIYPMVDDAFAAGDISFEHTVAIVNAMARVPGQFRTIVEKALVELAQDRTANDLGNDVETLLVACGVEVSADEAAAKRFAGRSLTLARTIDGIRSIAGGLTPEVGEMLEQALSSAATAAGSEDTRTVAQRQHDGFGDILRHYLAHADLPAVTGERPRLVVTIDYDALRGELHEAWGRLPSGAHVSPAVARRLACDAEILPAVLSARGDVLDIAVGSRSFSTAVRRAAWLEQNGRCAFPGCRRPPVDCHHIVWWIRGGASTLDNAAWLCAFHHWLVHEGGWRLRRESDRSLVFTGPAGQERSGARHPEAA
jgi:hypothetical protein